MKLTLKGTLVLLTGVVLSYTACKKSDNSAASNSSSSSTVSQDVAGGQIAVNLAQSLAGTYGGVSVNDGINTPSVATANTSGRAVNSLKSSSVCGFYIDTALSYNTNIGDTIKSSSTGSIKFYFVCSGTNQAIGYTAYDSLKTTGKAPGYSFNDALVQAYDVTGLNPNNSRIGVDGTLKSFVDVTYTKTSLKASSLHNIFTLKGISVDLSNPANVDFTSGEADFVSTGSTGSASWKYSGSIIFLGNHRAQIVFLSQKYYVDLLTGKVTS
jgi:hypothetical protein